MSSSSSTIRIFRRPERVMANIVVEVFLNSDPACRSSESTVANAMPAGPGAEAAENAGYWRKGTTDRVSGGYRCVKSPTRGPRPERRRETGGNSEGPKAVLLYPVPESVPADLEEFCRMRLVVSRFLQGAYERLSLDV